MDPLSISASVLTLIASTIASVQALHATVRRYKSRDKTLGRLHDGLVDLMSILSSMEAAANVESRVWTLLEGPIKRCAQVCHEFEKAMETFSGKSKIGLKDWTKLEFMRGDINEFIDTLAGYKSTITIGLGTITMHRSILTQQVVNEYNEMITDASYNLEMHLQRIDEKITSIAMARPTLSEESSINLQDEKAVTLQCLQICERASSHIKALQEGQPALQRDTSHQSAKYVLDQFEAQVLTHKTLSENRDSLLETIGRLQDRLVSMTSTGDPRGEVEMRRLHEEIDFSKQCLEVCRQASTQVSSQKIHIIGEVVAQEDCDQVVVTALADLFHIGKVTATNRSAQLVGSMPADVLRDMSKDRYGSRFGALGSSLDKVYSDVVSTSPTTVETQKAGTSQPQPKQAKEGKMPAGPDTCDRPAPNDARRRRAQE